MTIPVGGYTSILDAEADGLVHYWPMDEGSGGTADDLIGDYPMQITGATDVALTIDPGGKFGNCRKFQSANMATGSKFAVEHADTPALYSQWGLAFWFRFDVLSQYPNILDFGALSASDPVVTQLRGWLVDENGQIRIRAYAPSAYAEFLSSAGFVGEGAWRLFVFTQSATGLTVYVDGTAVLTQAGQFPLAVINDSRIGSYRPLNTPTSGMSADDAAFWARHLDSTDVARLYNGGDGVPVVDIPPPPVPEIEATLDATLGDMQASMRLFVDWAAAIDPLTTRSYYACALTGAPDGLDDVRLPISSWQATVQDGRADYVQAVVPAAFDRLDAITDRSNGEIVILRGVEMQDGSTREQEMARAPLQSSRLDRSPARATVTLSGYALETTYGATGERTLTGIRALSITDSSMRASADIDWFLRPGMIARADGYEITVAYINYYVNDGQAYMEIGDRNG